MNQRLYSRPAATPLMGSVRSTWKPLATLLALGFVLSVAPTRAWADSFTLGLATVDQENYYPDTGGPDSFEAAGGTFYFAEEFTPTLSSLSVVELVFEESIAIPATITVHVRPATVGETSISTVSLGSDSITTAGTTIGFHAGFTEFDFASPVALTPGNLYLIDASISDGRWALGANFLNKYTRGRGYWNGAFQGPGATDPGPNGNLEFVEGPLTHPTTTPEPTSFLLCVSGLLGLGGASWRRCR